MQIKKATLKDAKSIHSLVNNFAKKDKMLPRSLNEIYENIRNFFISTHKGKITGTCALHIMWETLAEIRSIAVLNEYQHRGIGKKLIEMSLNEAKALGVKKVFVLTYDPGF